MVYCGHSYIFARFNILKIVCIIKSICHIVIIISNRKYNISRRICMLLEIGFTVHANYALVLHKYFHDCINYVKMFLICSAVAFTSIIIIKFLLYIFIGFFIFQYYCVICLSSHYFGDII